MASPKDTTKDKRICLGKISAPHGVKGLVKIFAYGENPKLIETISPVYTSETANDMISIKLKNPMGKFILAEVEGCSNRDQSEALKGKELWINRSDLPELDSDEYYIEDLRGLSVMNQDKENVGTVLTIQNYGAGDLIEIKPQSGASYFVPFQGETVIDVDLNEKTVTLENPERFIIE